MESIGKYEILEKIGTGGFGTVYKAYDPFIKRFVAIKTCTTDEDCPPGTECKAFVCVPQRPCETQMECRGVRETCLDGFCECGGDCNTDGLVFGTEITKMICIWGEECPLEECPAGDLNGDGEITDAKTICTLLFAAGFLMG